ncbi:peptidase M56 [Paenibacillus polymyxa]|uniref:peptidase M56 n=1 Tax=Paenibacillus polymyxa TaxID=1406 RepID=UPI000AA2E769|nr:peptidase M56 [Paenibacillus polymyxa]
MIFKNKRRLYKLFAVVFLLLLFLSAILLTNLTHTEEIADPDMNARTVLKAGDTSSFKIDRLNSSFQWFHSLDRAIPFKKFDFKVPDHLPEGYQLEIVDLSTLFSDANQADLLNVVSIMFVSKFGSKNEQFIEMLASKGKGNMLEHNLLWGAPNSQKLAQTQFFQQSEVTLGNVKGVLFTKKQGSQHNRKAANSFVWQDNGVSYAINWEKLTQKEIEKVVQSFTFPQQVQRVSYDGEGNSFPLYDETDLLAAKNILGFKVKFPDSLLNTHLTLNDSILLRAEDQNTSYSFRQTADALWNTYRAPYNSTIMMTRMTNFFSIKVKRRFLKRLSSRSFVSWRLVGLKYRLTPTTTTSTLDPSIPATTNQSSKVKPTIFGSKIMFFMLRPS